MSRRKDSATTFSPISRVVPSFSPATFPGRLGVLCHAAAYSRARKCRALSFSSPDDLRPLGYAKGMFSGDIISVKRSEGRSSDDLSDLCFFSRTQSTPASVACHEVDLLLRRQTGEEQPQQHDDVNYDQECQCRKLWSSQLEVRGISRIACFPSELGSLGGAGRTLVGIGVNRGPSPVYYGTQPLTRPIRQISLILFDPRKGSKPVGDVLVGSGDKVFAEDVNDLCFAETTQHAILSTNSVFCIDLREEKVVWQMLRRQSWIPFNPRNYEVFSVGTAPRSASAWSGSVFVGACSQVSVVDERKPTELQLKLPTRDYTRQVLCVDEWLCILHGGGLHVYSLRMMGKPGYEGFAIPDVHTTISSSSSGGTIVALPGGSSFFSCVPGGKRCGMALWRLKDGGVKVLKTLDARTGSACLAGSESEDVSRQALVEQEERVQYSLSCEFLRMSPFLMRTRLEGMKVPMLFL